MGSPATPPPVGDRWGDVGRGSAVEILGDSPVADVHPGGKHRGVKRFPPDRRGAVDVGEETARENTNRLLVAQESYEADMHYAKTAHEIDIFTNSLSAGAGESYSRFWMNLLASCIGRALPLWLNSQEVCRGDSSRLSSRMDTM